MCTLVGQRVWGKLKLYTMMMGKQLKLLDNTIKNKPIVLH